MHHTDQTHKTLEERALTNFDHPDSLDTALLVQHIKDLKKGLSVEVPTYDFATHTRTKITEEHTPRKIILVEGILIFAEPELVKELDMKVFVVSERWTGGLQRMPYSDRLPYR
jgi:uridine kinase